MHKKMLTARKHCNAHAAYSKFRSALELLETFGLMSPGPNDEKATHEFVQELNREYAKFLSRYQRILRSPNNIISKTDRSAEATRFMPPLNVSRDKIVSDLENLTPGKATVVKTSPNTKEDMMSRQDLQEKVRQLQTQLKYFEKRLEKLEL